MIFGGNTSHNAPQLPDESEALAGRDKRPFDVGARHLVLDTPIETDPPAGYQEAVFGLGCFWGEEQTFWQLNGVWSTSVGYAGGYTPNPTYEEVCTGRTGHAEVVRIIYDPQQMTYRELLAVFWENHDPTQGMRQGNDRGSQYRSIILTASDEQYAEAIESRNHYQQNMTAAGYGAITTEIRPLDAYYYAEDYHQQYLVRNPHGYCPLHSTGVSYNED